MGMKTGINYCDSTLNLMMGCDGCELWEKRKGSTDSCYAGRMVEQYAGKPGFPVSFDQPVIYPDRIDLAKQWGDLTYKIRNDSKHHLDNFPRIIFVNDMGDGFTRLLPDDWLAPYIPIMESLPHIFLFLTKRVKRAAEFWRRYGRIPSNIWIGTTITSNANLSRAADLMQIPAAVRWLSIEPLLERITIKDYPVEWAVVGFESGMGARNGSPDWFRIIRDDCSANDTKFFVKQMGGIKNPRSQMYELPQDLRIREMPDWESLDWIGKTPPPVIQTTFI